MNRLIVFLVFLAVAYLGGCTNGLDEDDPIENTLFLLDLPANRWIEYHHLDDGDWWRKGHAGLAYDSSRGSLLVFGSDTHGEDWDNVVHEFLPRQRKWVHRGVDSAPDTYRVDPEGQRVAGAEDLAPWAMHTYDGVEYDPVGDNLIVVASPGHNPIGKQVPGPQSDPIWLYSLEQGKWSIFSHGEEGTPENYFGAATAYDQANGRLFICKAGIWSLELQSSKLTKIGSAPNCLHRSLALDSRRGYLHLFGSYEGTCNIHRYKTRDHLINR